MDRTRDHGHGRVEVRTLKVATVAGLCFPHAAQAIQVSRRARQADSHTWRTVTVYAVTSLALGAACPAQLAGYLRGHWTIENQLHYVRDVTFSDDASNARTGSLPA
jgi:predicted transposase YbfD/YdcC